MEAGQSGQSTASAHRTANMKTEATITGQPRPTSSDESKHFIHRKY